MPREKRSNLAQKLAIVALGAATLAIAYAGQLPALAYGPPPPPPVAPGGYQSVVTSRTVGPAGATIVVAIDDCKAFLTVPRGTFKTLVQFTITAPAVAEIGNAGHPGYRAICGIGVGITVNGKIYTGTFGHPLSLVISGFAIRRGDRVVVWNGSRFVFVSATVGRFGLRFSFTGSGEDFAVLARIRGFGGGHQFASPRRGVNAAVRSSHGTREAVLTSLFLTPPGLSPAGIGVLAPEWLTIISR
jgi:hypothetical protein